MVGDGQIAARREREVAGRRREIARHAHTKASRRADDLNLPGGHRAEARRVDGERLRVARSALNGLRGIGRAVCRRDVARTRAVDCPCQHLLISGDDVDARARIQRRVDADRLTDEIDSADGAFDAAAGAGHSRIPFQLDMAAGDVVAERVGVSEIGRRAARPGEELRCPRRQCHADGVGEARAAHGNAVRVRNDHRGGRAEHFERSIERGGISAARRGHLVDDGASGAAR